MTLVEGFPELGEPKFEKADVDGGWVANIAGIMQIATEGAKGGEPGCVLMVEAFKTAWAQTAHLKAGDRQLECINRALAEVGATLDKVATRH